MPKIGIKRQITLPKEQCRLAGIKPGDECQVYVNSVGHIIISKKNDKAAPTTSYR